MSKLSFSDSNSLAIWRSNFITPSKFYLPSPCNLLRFDIEAAIFYIQVVHNFATALRHRCSQFSKACGSSSQLGH